MTHPILRAAAALGPGPLVGPLVMVIVLRGGVAGALQTVSRVIRFTRHQITFRAYWRQVLEALPGLTELRS
jgi:hypothetical protein